MTIKVRIAVAVDPQGRWYCYGSGDREKNYIENHDQLLETTTFDTIGPSESLYWLTAELPVPEPQEITAVIED
jgi:hypothetical protein